MCSNLCQGLEEIMRTCGTKNNVSCLAIVKFKIFVSILIKGDFIVEKRLQPLIVLPRALDSAAVVINVSEGWKYVKADSVHCGKDVSEGLSLMEVEENDCNDTPVCDDIAHKVVS